MRYRVSSGAFYSPHVSLEDPVIITCAISGVLANREQCPAISYTLQEYAAEAWRIVDEIVELLEAMNVLGIRAEHECFDLGHVGSLHPRVATAAEAREMLGV